MNNTDHGPSRTYGIEAKHDALVASGMKPTLAWKQIIKEYPAEYEAYARPAPTL